MISGIYHRLVVILLVLLQVSCSHKPSRERSPVISEKEKDEMLLRVNKYLVQKDIELIEAYAARRGWDMKVTETGLYYDIFETTDGKKAEYGQEVKIFYEISLLDGSVCYSSDEDGPKEFRIGRSQEISGLEQGISLMREGEKARFIIPPHLAYGLLGDELKIPARSILVSLVELEEIK